MPHVKDKELFVRIKNSEIAPVYFLYGAESYFVRFAVQKIIKKVIAGSMTGFNLQRFQGHKTTVGEIEDACDVLPVMADKKCVAVCDLNIEKLVKTDLDRLLSIVSFPSDTTVLLLYMTNIEVNIKKSSKYKKLAEAVSKSGIVCDFALKDKVTLNRILCSQAKKAHASMDTKTADTLINRCSSNYSVLINEMEKLISHADGGEITEKDIEECCVRSIDASAFDLAKSILCHKYDKAFHLLEELFSLRQEPVSILGALSLAFSDIYRAKCALIVHRSQNEMAADFHYPKNRMFAVRNAFRDVKGFSLEHIRGCITALYDADRILKTKKADSKLVLEQMLGKMFLFSVQERRI